MAVSTNTSERSKKTLCGSSELAWEACEEDSGRRAGPLVLSVLLR